MSSNFRNAQHQNRPNNNFSSYSARVWVVITEWIQIISVW